MRFVAFERNDGAPALGARIGDEVVDLTALGLPATLRALLEQGDAGLVATLVAVCSEAMTLHPGDIIISGTPSGVGFARKPPILMQPGDVCEIDVEGIGVLRNPVIDEPR